MIRKVQYETQLEYDQLIADAELRKERLILVENITGGNYLTFTDDLGDSEQLAKLVQENTTLKADAQTLDERTVGMQAIDDFTLQAQATIDERTVGMQEIDDFTLQLVNDQAVIIAQLQADVAQLKGGV